MGGIRGVDVGGKRHYVGGKKLLQVTVGKNMENVIDTVRRIGFGVQDYDRLAPLDPDMGILPIRALRVRAHGKQAAFECASAIGSVIGLGIVWEGDSLTVIGTTVSLKFWQWPLQPFGLATTEAMDFIGPPDTPHRKTHQLREQRIGRLRIQHKVSELYPALRAWGDHRAEVVLHREAGEVRAGGIIFDLHTPDPLTS